MERDSMFIDWKTILSENTPKLICEFNESLSKSQLSFCKN